MADQVIIFDTTLRDGEQSPGISLDVGEKLEIAEQLARLGVDVIEAGFPVASQGDFEATQAIARAVRGPGDLRPVAHRAAADVDRCWEAIQDAEPTAHPHLPRHQRDPHEAQAAHDPRAGEDRGGAGRGAGQGLHRRRRVLARGRLPLRLRLHVRGAADRGRQRCHHAEHPRHGRLRRPRGVRGRGLANVRERRHRRLRDLGALPRRPRAWPSPTRWPPSRTAPARSSARSTASASGPATPRSRRS